MKSTTALLIASLALLPILAQSQTVPGLMSYQGIVTDAANNLIGAGTPVNREVFFRVYDAATGGNIIYSEKQTATIANGEFSVLVGSGTQIGTEPHGAFADAFGAAARYLGVTVDGPAENGAGDDPEVSPRQQIVTTAFAFQAKRAETVVDGSISTTALANSAITLGKLAGNSVDGSKITDGSIATADVANGAVTAAKLGSDVGLWSVSGSTVYRPAGTFNVNEVGIGTSSPAARLHVSDGSSGNPVISSAVLVVEDDSSAVVQLNSGNSNDAGFAFGRHGNNNHGRIFYDGNENMKFATSSADRLTILSDGNVGIGTTNPDGKLHTVSSGLNFFDSNSPDASAGLALRTSTESQRGVLGFAGANGALSSSALDGDVILRADTGKLHLQGGTGAAAMTITQSNNIGIGTSNPTHAKLVVNGVSPSTPINANTRLYWQGAPAAGYNDGYTGTVTNDVSIWASHSIVAASFRAVSDARIKLVEGHSDGNKDLETLGKIKVTDYTYLDNIGKGSRSHKKVIAQQVEKVFPHAVSISTDVIPDIYQRATITEGWIELATQLKVGDRVKLIAKEATGLHEVLEIGEGRFRTALTSEEDTIFVYGREVDDFRSVDYDAISMLNVSATQEIHRQLEAEKAKNAALERRLAALEAKDQARDAKLVAIEALLRAAAKAPAQTAALKLNGQ